MNTQDNCRLSKCHYYLFTRWAKQTEKWQALANRNGSMTSPGLISNWKCNLLWNSDIGLNLSSSCTAKKKTKEKHLSWSPTHNIRQWMWSNKKSTPTELRTDINICSWTALPEQASVKQSYIRVANLILKFIITSCYNQNKNSCKHYRFKTKGKQKSYHTTWCITPISSNENI